MRRRLWTRSRSCSTTVSRRNRGAFGAKSGGAFGARGIAAACVLLLAVAARGGGQEIELSTVAQDGLVTAHLAFRGVPPGDLIESLHKGLESRITFSMRLYEKRRPAFAFAGDRIVAQKIVARSVFWDFLDKVYVVAQDGDGQIVYRDPRELLEGFFTLEETLSSSPARGRLYVTARAQFEPVRLMPPLTLVSKVGAAANVTTPWSRRDLP